MLESWILCQTCLELSYKLLDLLKTRRNVAFVGFRSVMVCWTFVPVILATAVFFWFQHFWNESIKQCSTCADETSESFHWTFGRLVSYLPEILKFSAPSSPIKSSVSISFNPQLLINMLERSGNASVYPRGTKSTSEWNISSISALPWFFNAAVPVHLIATKLLRNSQTTSITTECSFQRLEI